MAMVGSVQAAMDVVENWAKAFTAADVDGIAKLYASDATMIGTSGKAVMTTPEQIRHYFEVALHAGKPRTATLESSEALVVDEDTVVIAGFDTITSVRDGAAVVSRGRVTFVVAKHAAVRSNEVRSWLIVHLHRSPLPAT